VACVWVNTQHKKSKAVEESLRNVPEKRLCHWQVDVIMWGAGDTVVWDGDKVGDKVEAIWPEVTKDGRKYFYPCTIQKFRGTGKHLEVLVQWDAPGTFEATCWVSLDQVRDRVSLVKKGIDQVVWDGDKVGDKVEAIWPEVTKDGRKYFYPCTLQKFRGTGKRLEVLVQWDAPGTFEATCWVSLDQVRDRVSLVKKAHRQSKKACWQSKQAWRDRFMAP
jgi:uncharacterized OB-fold protein